MVRKYFSKNPLVGAFSVVKVEIFGFLIFFLTETFFVKSVLTFVLLGTKPLFFFENLEQKKKLGEVAMYPKA